MSQAYYFKKVLHTITAPLLRMHGNQVPQIERIPVYIRRLPTAFQGFRLAVISDLHLPDSLSSPAQVVAAVQRLAPDVILLSGDIANRYGHFDADGISTFLQALTALAPCYAVTGNHEQHIHFLPPYRALLQKVGVTLLEDQKAILHKGKASLPIYGICDPTATVPTITSPALLLLHYPELAPKLAHKGFSLAICGHAHGGQIRCGRHSLFAPGQGFFPKYTSGLYRVGQLQMVVSRGLGDSSLPIRWHNPPHLPLVELRTAD